MRRAAEQAEEPFWVERGGHRRREPRRPGLGDIGHDPGLRQLVDDEDQTARPMKNTQAGRAGWARPGRRPGRRRRAVGAGLFSDVVTAGLLLGRQAIDPWPWTQGQPDRHRSARPGRWRRPSGAGHGSIRSARVSTGAGRGGPPSHGPSPPRGSGGNRSSQASIQASSWSSASRRRSWSAAAARAGRPRSGGPGSARCRSRRPRPRRRPRAVPGRAVRPGSRPRPARDGPRPGRRRRPGRSGTGPPGGGHDRRDSIAELRPILGAAAGPALNRDTRHRSARSHDIDLLGEQGEERFPLSELAARQGRPSRASGWRP